MRQAIDSSFLYTRGDGSQEFVHDTYRDFFLARAIAARLSSGRIPFDEAHELCSRYESSKSDKFRKAYESLGEAHLFRLHSSGENLDTLHHLVAEISGDDFILSINALELSRLRDLIGKRIELRYYETDDDDEGFRHDYETKYGLVLEGIVGGNGRFYFVGHSGNFYYVLSPGFKPVPEYVDGGILRHIFHAGRSINVEPLFRPADYVQGSQIKAMAEKGESETNPFLEPEYLRENGLRWLF
ncbi:hypothetical protein KY361_02475 [Candidatus Woesearchaeota archaeon]|nr:hypothetical protein [Candidatus Woesearchaeota archaeon]